MAKISQSQKSTAASLDSIYQAVEKLMLKYSPPFRTDIASLTRAKKSLQLTVPKPVAIPGAYGGKPTHLEMAAIIRQKDFVGFYLMPIYVDPSLKKELSAALLKLLKGKTCFHLKRLDDVLLRDIQHALAISVAAYQRKGWA